MRPGDEFSYGGRVWTVVESTSRNQEDRKMAFEDERDRDEERWQAQDAAETYESERAAELAGMGHEEEMAAAMTEAREYEARGLAVLAGDPEQLEQQEQVPEVTVLASHVARAQRLAPVMSADRVHEGDEPWTVADVLNVALTSGLEVMEFRYLQPEADREAGS
jgi:NAD(P)H-hydrate repair Nnr-like enzyme with NAD(P)H-hydrate dehydratase domain